MRKWMLLVLLTAFGVPCAAQAQRALRPEIISPGFNRDVVEVSPKTHTVIDRIGETRVLRAQLAPGQVIPVHEGRAGLLVCITDCHLRIETPHGHVTEIRAKAGETHRIDEDTYSQKNIGSGRLVFVLVEFLRIRNPQG